MTTFKFNDPNETRFVVKHRSLEKLTPEYIKATDAWIAWFRSLDKDRKDICMHFLLNFVDAETLDWAHQKTLLVELTE